MPITKIIPARNVAMTSSNELILSLWARSEGFVPEDQKENVLDPANINNLKGLSKKIIKWLAAKEILDIGDRGQTVTIKELKLDLDSMAYDLFERITGFLVKTAKQMKLNSEIDKDLYERQENAIALEHPYALVKEIIRRIVLKILSTKSNKDDVSNQQLKVLQDFIKELSNVEKLNFDKKFYDYFFDSQGKPSIFNKIFLQEASVWQNTIQRTVKEVELLNLTKNIIESNYAVIDSLQMHVLRFLYVRLQLALNQNTRTNDTTNDWLRESVRNAEEKIIALMDKQQRLIHTASYNDDSTLSLQVTRERKELVCIALKKVKKVNEHNISLITNLYDALYNITFSKNLTGLIDRLTTLTGCLPFLWKYINADELERYILLYAKECLNACTREGLADTSINMITISNGEPCLDKLKKLPFSKLGESEILDAMSTYIMALMAEITRSCDTNNCITIINEPHTLLTFTPSRIEPSLLTVRQKEMSMAMIPCNNPVPIQEAIIIKSSFLDSLNISREHLRELYQHFQNESESPDKSLWRFVGRELYEVYKGKELSIDFQCYLKDSLNGKSFFEEDVYQAAFVALYCLAYRLREELKKHGVHADVWQKSNYDLLLYVDKQNFPWLNKYKSTIEDCKQALDDADLMLADATQNKSFVLAYFEYWYLYQQGDLIYKPCVPTTIKSLAEYYKLQVIVIKPLPDIENDDINSCKEPQKIIHIGFDNHSIAMTELKKSDSLIVTIKNDVLINQDNNQDKKDLYKLLFDVQNNVADFNSRKEIFDYFITDKSEIASRGIMNAKYLLDSARSSAQTYQSKMDINRYFLHSAKVFIFSGMLEFVIKYPCNLISKSYQEMVNSEINNLITRYMNDQIFKDYEAYSSERKIVMGNTKFTLSLMQQSVTNETEFLAFRNNYYYLHVSDDKYQCFEKISVAPDGNCALYALDIDTRDNFIDVLKKAVLVKENREVLALEICNELSARCFEGREVSTEWKSLHKKYEMLNNELSALRKKFSDQGLICKESNDDLASLLDDKDKFTVEMTADALKFQEKLREYKILEKQRRDYCVQPSTINMYVNELARKDNLIGKHALYIYCKQINTLIHIYDEQNTTLFNELKLDKETSLTNLSNPRGSKFIIKKKEHFDKLSSRNFIPQNDARSYLENLKKRISEDAVICRAAIGKSTDDYEKNLQRDYQALKGNMSLMAKDIKELAALNHSINQVGNISDIEKDRNKLYAEISKNKLLVSYIPLINKCQNQLVLIDEPRDPNTDNTLLYDAIEKNDMEMAKFLLDKKASVASQNGKMDFDLTVRSPVRCDHTYFLEKIPGNKWKLQYYLKADLNPVIVPTEDIIGLDQLLKNKIKFNADDIAACKRCIRPYHEKRQSKFPLILVAKNVSKKLGFNQDRSLYFSMLSRAQEEVSFNSDVWSNNYPYSSHLCNHFIVPITHHLSEYTLIQKKRSNSNVKRATATMYSGEDQARIVELALAYLAVIEAVKTNDYIALVDSLCLIHNNARSRDGSKLHTRLAKILQKAYAWKMAHSRELNLEMKDWDKNINSSLKNDKTVNAKKTQQDEITEVSHQHQSSNAQLNIDTINIMQEKDIHKQFLTNQSKESNESVFVSQTQAFITESDENPEIMKRSSSSDVSISTSSNSLFTQKSNSVKKMINQNCNRSDIPFQAEEEFDVSSQDKILKISPKPNSQGK